jgi:hypothetical protein
MKRLLLVALTLAAGVARAQAPAPAAPSASASATAPAATDRVVRVFEIRHADMQEVSLIVPTLLSDGNVLTVDAKSHTVTVVDSPEFVARVESWLQQFDVPRQAVLVRVVIEKAERSPQASDVPGWRYSPLAETTVEVQERGTTTQSIGPDGAFEIRVKLGSVDAARGLLHFDQVAVRRRDPALVAGAATPDAAMRDLFATTIDAKDQVPKVVMATSDPSSDVALVLRLLAMIRKP